MTQDSNLTPQNGLPAFGRPTVFARLAFVAELATTTTATAAHGFSRCAAVEIAAIAAAEGDCRGAIAVGLARHCTGRASVLGSSVGGATGMARRSLARALRAILRDRTLWPGGMVGLMRLVRRVRLMGLVGLMRL
jgi:hypothetical protein